MDQVAEIDALIGRKVGQEAGAFKVVLNADDLHGQPQRRHAFSADLERFRLSMGLLVLLNHVERGGAAQHRLQRAADLSRRYLANRLHDQAQRAAARRVDDDTIAGLQILVSRRDRSNRLWSRA